MMDVTSLGLGGGFKYVFFFKYVHAYFGEMIQFDEHILQNGLKQMVPRGLIIGFQGLAFDSEPNLQP